MAEAQILDAEAVNSLAPPLDRKVLAARASAVLSHAFERRALVYDLNRIIAQQVGHMLESARFRKE